MRFPPSELISVGLRFESSPPPIEKRARHRPSHHRVTGAVPAPVLPAPSGAWAPPVFDSRRASARVRQPGRRQRESAALAVPPAAPGFVAAVIRPGRRPAETVTTNARTCPKAAGNTRPADPAGRPHPISGQRAARHQPLRRAAVRRPATRLCSRLDAVVSAGAPRAPARTTSRRLA
jgi:hypothetical protein